MKIQMTEENANIQYQQECDMTTIPVIHKMFSTCSSFKKYPVIVKGFWLHRMISTTRILSKRTRLLLACFWQSETGS